MDNNEDFDTMFMMWMLGRASQECAAQDLHEDWYSTEEIADELDIDEDEVRDIVWDDDE